MEPVNPRLAVTSTINISVRYNKETKNELAALAILPDSSGFSLTSILQTVEEYHKLSPTVEDPRRRLSMLGQGVAGLSGLGSVQIAPAEVAPQASPLTTALGLGLAGADIYGRIFGKKS